LSKFVLAPFFGSVLKPVFKNFPNEINFTKVLNFCEEMYFTMKNPFSQKNSIFYSKTAKTLYKGQSPTQAL
jgi:hypothetical protein